MVRALYKERGMTLIEILLVLAILGILALVAVVNFAGKREQVTLRTGTEAVYFALEQAKADALAGKGGEPQGVKFNSDSFVRFSGASYSGGASENLTTKINDILTISTTLSGDETIIFSRLTGSTGGTATVTVAVSDDVSVFEQIVVGPLGDINRVDN